MLPVMKHHNIAKMQAKMSAARKKKTTVNIDGKEVVVDELESMLHEATGVKILEAVLDYKT